MKTTEERATRAIESTTLRLLDMFDREGLEHDVVLAVALLDVGRAMIRAIAFEAHDANAALDLVAWRKKDRKE